MQPDIEIYIKDLSQSALEQWLAHCFSTLDSGTISTIDLASNKQHKLILQHEKNDIPLTITPNAAGKAFTSLWFESDKTPWANDLECAESALDLLQLEVRCSAESWTEEEEEFSEKWWKLTQDTRELIVWG